MAAMGYPGAKVSERRCIAKIISEVEDVLMPSMRRTMAATRAWTTTIHLGSKRAVSAHTGDVSRR